MDLAASKLVFLNPPGAAEWVLFILFFLIVIYGSLKSVRHLQSARRKVTIVSLHVAAFLLLSIILTNPALRVERYKEQKRNLAVLVDGSWSMNLARDASGKSRIEVARDFLETNRDFFTNLEENFFVNYYRFDETLRPASMESFIRETPEGRHTDFKDVINQVRDRSGRGEIDEVILISDGGDNGDKSGNMDEDLKNMGVKINTVGAATEERSNDFWIDEIISSEVSFLRYPYSVDVVVRSSERGGMKIPVSLYDGDKLISIKEAPIDLDSKSGKVDFEINPITLGRKIYTVSIPVLSDEIIDENNQKSFYTDVIINKIRVLHVAGSPSWDVRFLRKTLKRNPNIDLVSFFILRDPSDLVFATENELSLIPFPVNEIFGSELRTFDIVIFQNFNFQPYGIFGFHLRSIKDYVLNDGGAFLMIGGHKSFDSGNYGRTPISEILPVELDYLPRTLSETISDDTFHPKLTIAGKNHPIMKIISDKEENEEQWNSMPELEGFNIVQGLNPDAVPLLVSPEGEPIFAVAKVKSGKVGTFLSDSSWKWNFVKASEGDLSPHYEKFWNRLFLWFVNDPELSDTRVKTDKAIYNPGENPELKIDVLDLDDEKVEIEPFLTLPDGSKRGIALEKVTSERYRGRIKAPELGTYSVSLDRAEDAGPYDDSESGRISFIVVPPDKEVRGPTADIALLRSIASETGGNYIDVSDNPEKLKIDSSGKKTITGYETAELWDKPVFLLLIVALLFSDWFLRRRWGLR